MYVSYSTPILTHALERSSCRGSDSFSQSTYETSYYEWEASVSYEWASIDTSVDIYEGEDVDVSESVSDEEINSEESYAENESFDVAAARAATRPSSAAAFR